MLSFSYTKPRRCLQASDKAKRTLRSAANTITAVLAFLRQQKASRATSRMSSSSYHELGNGEASSVPELDGTEKAMELPTEREPQELDADFRQIHGPERQQYACQGISRLHKSIHHDTTSLREIQTGFEAKNPHPHEHERNVPKAHPATPDKRSPQTSLRRKPLPSNGDHNQNPCSPEKVRTIIRKPVHAGVPEPGTNPEKQGPAVTTTLRGGRGLNRKPVLSSARLTNSAQLEKSWTPQPQPSHRPSQPSLNPRGLETRRSRLNVYRRCRKNFGGNRRRAPRNVKRHLILFGCSRTPKPKSLKAVLLCPSEYRHEYDRILNAGYVLSTGQERMAVCNTVSGSRLIASGSLSLHKFQNVATRKFPFHLLFIQYI